MIIEAARHERIEVALLAHGAKRLVLVQIEIFTTMLDLGTEGDLPVVRNPVCRDLGAQVELAAAFLACHCDRPLQTHHPEVPRIGDRAGLARLCALLDLDGQDRKSTRLNSSHLVISYAVFCLKKKKI